MTPAETKVCQNCKASFEVDASDFAFYEKIGVPPPTWCPQCRLQRRMAVCNERTLYKRTCDLCGRSTIAMYPHGVPFPVYCISCWRSDTWDGVAYGREYDFSRPFFTQCAELKKVVPRVALHHQGNMEGSEYANRSSNNKNCYLVFRTNFSENCFYTHPANNSKDCMDCLNAQKCELAYGCVDCVNCYNVRYLQECKNCDDSWFLYDCRNCTDCFACVGLRHKRFHIFNTPYSKDAYVKKLKELNTEGFRSVEAIKDQFRRFSLKFPREYMMSTNSAGASGNWLDECKNVLNSYACRHVEDGKYLYAIIEGKDCMDYFYFGRGCELIYETANCGYNCSRIYFSNESMIGSHDLEYCDNCFSSSYLFGCVGLKEKKYCILNRQYDEKEYTNLLPKIVEHMAVMPYVDAKGREYRRGEFFPVEHAVFGYNETIAQEYFPLIKEEALNDGYHWKDPEPRAYGVTLRPEDIPDRITDVNDDFLGQVIQCAHNQECGETCTQAFRIIPYELALYRKMNLSLPRLCPNCRHHERLRQRNSLTLWKRTCHCAGAKSERGTYANTAAHFHGAERCPNKFETSYAPERPEIVYCEQCYQAEVA